MDRKVTKMCLLALFFIPSSSLFPHLLSADFMLSISPELSCSAVFNV